MLLHNIKNSKLGNGSRGVITNIINNIPYVRFMNGVEIPINYFTWEIRNYNTNKHLLNITQIPLKLAYAITIHKSQGMTLDNVIINFKHSFANGQIYVALSRVKSLNSLSIKNLDFNQIKADPKVVRYYKNIIHNYHNENLKQVKKALIGKY